MKILTFIILGYFAYKVFFQRKRIPPKQEQPKYNQWQEKEKTKNNKGDYIDYEEVE